MDQKESNELDIRTLKADFAVDIEEVLTKECSSYECVLCDEHDIGVLWSFLIENSISGFIGVEDNEDSIGIATVTTGIHLKEITDADRDSLMHILDLNSELINATFTVAHIQDKQEEAEPIFAEEGESIEYEEEDEEAPKRDILMIQCKIPLSVFEAEDFQQVIQNLMIQSDMALHIDPETGAPKEDDEEED